MSATFFILVCILLAFLPQYRCNYDTYYYRRNIGYCIYKGYFGRCTVPGIFYPPLHIAVAVSHYCGHYVAENDRQYDKKTACFFHCASPVCFFVITISCLSSPDGHYFFCKKAIKKLHLFLNSSKSFSISSGILASQVISSPDIGCLKATLPQ